MTFRILKVVEEAGDAAAAWIGVNKPRKGRSHDVADVAAELADVAITALIAIESLDLDHRDVLAACARKVSGRVASDATADRRRPSRVIIAPVAILGHVSWPDSTELLTSAHQ